MPSNVEFPKTTHEVNLNLPDQMAFSINAATCRDARFKTVAYKDWYSKIKASIQMNGSYKSLLDFAETFKQDNHQSIEIEIDIYYPNWLFYTSKGTISSKTFDISNTEKILIDLLLVDILQINDKNVTRLISSKHPAKAYGINITLALMPYSTPNRG